MKTTKLTEQQQIEAFLKAAMESPFELSIRTKDEAIANPNAFEKAFDKNLDAARKKAAK